MRTERIVNRMRLLAGLIAVIFVVTGCASQQQQQQRRKKPAPPPTTRQAEQPVEPVMMGAGNMTTLYVPTGERATSALELVKSGPDEVNLGSPFEYTITATNIGGQTLEGVVVSDMIPQGLEILSSDPAITNSQGGTMMWNLGDLPPGASRTVRVQAVANAQGTLRYCAEVTYNQLACIETRVVEPQLSLVKSMPGEVLACDPIPVRLVVANNGTGAARNVMITDNLPNGLMSADGRNSVSFNVGSLAAGEQRELMFDARASGPGTFENMATASADGGLSADAGASVTVRQPMLTITKEGPDVTYAGRRITWEIMVQNTGDGPARDCMIQDTLPPNVTYVSSNPPAQVGGGTLVWNLGTLQPDASATVTVTVSADQLGMARNTATVSAYCADAQSADSVCEVRGIPAVLLEVIDVEDPIPVGNNETYVIRVTNQGSATDTNIQITCELEDSMAFVSGGGATATDQTGQTVSFRPLASLAPKAVAEWRVTVRAVSAGDVRFTVIMNTDELQREVRETEATNFYE